MARKVPINLYLEQAQVDRLAKLREKTRVPVSAHMRMAVDAYLKKAENFLDEGKGVMKGE